jgi:hypothetical protein
MPFIFSPLKKENRMNILRYSIRKKELHELLRAIGILRKVEELLFVSNRELVDPATETVSITVATDGDTGVVEDRYRRFVELALLHDALASDMRYVVDEIKKLVQEREAASAESGESDEPSIPETIEKSIREQIERILSSAADDEAKKN